MKDKRFILNYIFLKKKNVFKQKKSRFFYKKTETNNSLVFTRNFIFNFKQYFRFFVFFKYLLRFSNKKKTKGFLNYFLLLPKYKKSRSARMGKGNGAYKGYFWQAVSGTRFLTFFTKSNPFFWFILKKINQKLPFTLSATTEKSFIFLKKNLEIAQC